MTYHQFKYKFSDFFLLIYSKFSIFGFFSSLKFIPVKVPSTTTFVTASDSSHFKSLMNLLRSINDFEPNARISVWDLGLNKNEINQISKSFPAVEISKFQFDKYPVHFCIKVNAGQYAWKPAIVFEEMKKNLGILIWLDAGNILVKRLFWIKKYISFFGFYSPYSPGRIQDWTHPRMIESLGAAKFASKRNLNGAILGFDSGSIVAQDLVNSWFLCALNPECISPQGSSRTNHRQDQSAISCLAYKNLVAHNGAYRANLNLIGIKIHQDVD